MSGGAARVRALPAPLRWLVGMALLAGCQDLGLGRRGVGSGTRVERTAAPERPPNVLILLWDTTRADRLGMYGYGRPTTPRLDAWAEGGVIFERALSPAMWTVPSHASMFTGLEPTTHGADTTWRWLDSHHVTMAEWLGAQGYDTYAFSANPNLSPTRINLVQGFDTVDTSWSRPWKGKVTANANRKLLANDRSTEISPSFDRIDLTRHPFTYNAAPVTPEAFTRWLEQRDDPSKPWFAYLSYMEAHKPRIPDLGSRRKLAEPAEIATQLSTDLSFRNQLAYSYGLIDYSQKELDAIRGVYDATLVELDHHTGTLLDALEEGGHLQNTLVVFTSDHGELLGEHGLFGHRHSIYQSLVHVPLVLAWPGHLEPKRILRPVTTLDLFNTVLELTGLPKPPTTMSTGNLLTDKGDGRGLYTEMVNVDIEGWDIVKRLYPDVKAEGNVRLRTHRGLVRGKWKVIVDSQGFAELYDVVADPGETTDLSAKEPERLAEMIGHLEAYHRSLPSYDPTQRTDEDRPDVDDPETREQLELLGYVDGDE